MSKCIFFVFTNLIVVGRVCTTVSQKLPESEEFEANRTKIIHLIIKNIYSSFNKMKSD